MSRRHRPLGPTGFSSNRVRHRLPRFNRCSRTLVVALLFPVVATGSSLSLAGATVALGQSRDPVATTANSSDAKAPTTAAAKPATGDLSVAIYKRNPHDGSRAPVAKAKVRIAGSDTEGDETNASGVVRLSMPSERRIDLQVMVPSSPTCVLANIPIAAPQSMLKVLIEPSQAHCRASLISN